MVNLNIERLSGFVDMARDYEIHIDGVFSGVISNGSSDFFTVTPGIHSVSVKVGWSSSQGREIELKENKEMFLRVGPSKTINRLMIINGLIIGAHYIIDTLFNFEYLILLFLPSLLYSLIFLVFRRKKYLEINEVAQESTQGSKRRSNFERLIMATLIGISLVFTFHMNSKESISFNDFIPTILFIFYFTFKEVQKKINKI